MEPAEIDRSCNPNHPLTTSIYDRPVSETVEDIGRSVVAIKELSSQSQFTRKPYGPRVPGCKVLRLTDRLTELPGPMMIELMYNSFQARPWPADIAKVCAGIREEFAKGEEQ